ncbi:MAG: DUF4410 domain-containing protein [Myxococcaceae bacterium]
MTTPVKTVLLLSMAMWMGCGSSLKAARSPTGERIAVAVIFELDPAVRNMDQVEQVIGFMQPDLERILRGAGYVVKRGTTRGEFTPSPNHYAVVIRVTRYDPGSKAARMMVGLGAGTLVLDTQNELLGAPENVLFQSNSSVGSSRDWNNAARKINLQVAREITSFLSAR